MSQQPYQQQYPAQAPPPPATKAKKPRRWPWILGILAAFGLGAAVGSAGGSTPAPAGAGASTSAVATSPAHSTAAPPATTQAAAPAGPKTEFGDGTYLVGTDIAVGSYKSSGPRPDGVGQCYWARLRDDSGANIIANNLGAGATRVTVKKGEYLQITGCDFTKA
jgi:hypothetical protein